MTKTQRIIDYVGTKGPCTWTDIQKFIVEELCDGGKYDPSSTHRGWGTSGIWICAKNPARGRKDYITKGPNGYYRRVWAVKDSKHPYLPRLEALMDRMGEWKQLGKACTEVEWEICGSNREDLDEAIRLCKSNSNYKLPAYRLKKYNIWWKQYETNTLFTKFVRV